MINVYDKSPSYRTSFRAADFYSLLSAYDETVSRNLGISHSSQDDVKKSFVFQGKVKNPRKNKDEGSFSKEISSSDYHKPKTLQHLLVNNDVKEYSKHNPIIFNDLCQQSLTGFSCSLPQALEKISSDIHNTKFWTDLQTNNSLSINKDSPKFSNKHQVKLLDHLESTRGSNIVVRQVDATAETMTIGLPNCRALPSVQKTPRIIRARIFFNQIKTGLKEHIEWHTTQLQQAELDQDVISANKALENVNQLQHRLNTIRCLEHEYMKHWKLYREIRARSQGEFYCDQVNSGSSGSGKSGEESIQLSQCSTNMNNSSLLSKNKLSKSTLALTGFNGSDHIQPSTTTVNTTNPFQNHSHHNNNSICDTTNYLPTIIEKRPKYSSLLNLIRHKSKKTTNNYLLQNENRPRAATTASPVTTTAVDQKHSFLHLNRSSNLDLTTTHIPLKKSATLLTHNNNSHYNKGLSKSRSSARDLVTNDASFKQQQEVLLKRLCQIEAQTEYLSGTLICEVIGVSGSVSSLSKDVFRISLKYDTPVLSSIYELKSDKELPDVEPLYTSTVPLNQKGGSNDKWTITGRLFSSSSLSPSSSAQISNSSKSSAHFQATYLNDVNLKFPEQKWDQTKHIFSPTIGDVLTIKVDFMRRFGKPETLIQQACDILKLITLKGHHISVGLKNFTDLQFHFILKWCPLADTKDDRMLFYNLSTIQLNNFLDEQRQRTSSVKMILNEGEINDYSSPKMDYSNIKRYHTNLISSEFDNRYNEPQQLRHHYHHHHQQQLTNLIKTETCSNSSDLENKGSVTILTVRSNRRTPSRYGEQNKCHSKLPKWISLPDLETHELSEPELMSPEIRIITVRTHQNHENRGHQNNYVDIADTNIINTTNSHNNYYDNMDNHTYISESSTQDIELTQERQTEQPVPINDRTSVKINTIQTAESRLLISKPTNNQLSEHLSKLKDKVDIKIRIHDDPTGLLKDLDKAITNLVKQLENNSYWFNQLYVSNKAQNPKSIISSPVKPMEKNIDEKNTLKSLWESLAFLDEPEKSFDGYIEDGSTSSISGSSHSVRVFEKTNIYTCDSDQIIKTTGWTQLDLALIWHLNYTIRLLDKVYPDHLYVSSSQTLLSAQSSVSDVSDKTINNYTHNGSLSSVRNSVHSAWSTLPLLEQVEFFNEVESLCQGIIDDLQTVESNYLLKVCGDGKPYSTLRFTCFLSKLIWPVENNNTVTLSDDLSSPQIIFDRDAFRETLLRFYEKDVVPRWSKDMANGVIDHFIEDVLDLQVNGSELSTIPLTHLNLRLKLSERMESTVLSNRLSDQHNRDQLKQFNVYFIQLLSYLAGQLYIQWNLENAYSSRTLSTLPYFTRALQPIFGLNVLLSDVGVDPSYLEQIEYGLDMRSTELAACHSTQTWLRVAELVGNHDEEINKKAIMLLKSMNEKIYKVFQHITNLKQKLHLSNDVQMLQGTNNHINDYHQLIQKNSRNTVRRPIFYLMGPPIHIQYCLNKNCIKQNLNSLSPIWISMIWGLEQKSNIKRIAALKALTVLIESQINETIKTTQNNNANNKNCKLCGNTNDSITNSTLLQLLNNMHSNDSDPLVKNLAGQIIDRITTRSNTESHNEQITKPTRLLKTIWTKFSTAENLPSKPSYIFQR
ncbi:unnamed protein product [Schistosoma haematobium]|nr:unnamed protein product [Schistosoma haematobium]CAH8523741.1 unnamed protein product [Schistosoma haematobium]